MFPLGDDNSMRRSTPYVTYILIAINVAVFLLELQNSDEFIKRWAFVPARFSADEAGNIPTIFTAMFMHGSWLHLGGNMLYLWIFGDNVEDRFGHFKFLIFYLLTGIAATFAQYYVMPDSSVPNVGASGAIAGVLGAYLVTFPRARVLTLIPIFIFPWFVEIPALIYLVFWFVMQLLEGIGTLGMPVETGGVAVWAHIGGFVAGVVLVKLMQPPRRRPQPLEVRP